MPVKKNKAGKRHHHDKNGEHSRQMNKDRDAIKKMVGDIPALIMKEGYFDKKIEAQPIKKEENSEKNVIVRSEQSERRDNPLVEETYFDNSDTNEDNDEAQLRQGFVGRRRNTPIVLTHPKKRLWLWTGVIIVSIVIFGIWMLNIKNIFYDIRNSKGFEESIIGSSKQDFNDIWNAMKINDKKIEEQAKKDDADATASTTDKNLELFLNEIIAPLKNTSTTK